MSFKELETQDLESMLAAATPGPWGCRWDEGHLAIVGPDEEAIAFDADERDSNLIVAAPEAVAEVVRLREELEALRRACIESAEVSERNAEIFHFPEIHEEVAGTERDTADIITRILDGSNDE